MDQERKKELLRKFSERSLNPQEQQEFWEMIDSGTHYDLLEEDLDLETTSDIDLPMGMEDSLINIKGKVAAQIKVPAKKTFKLFYQIATGIAAVLAIVAGVKVYQYQRFVTATATFITLKVPVGSIREIILADSSIITAFSGTVISYPKAFKEDERTVYLTSGKAFFQVVKNPAKPFSVNAGKLKTTVLGTSFTVQHNPNYQWSKIKLYTGKVKIQETAKSTSEVIYLSPGKAYELNDGKGKLSLFNPLLPDTTENGLLFESTAFNEAIYRIASYYNINIVFDKVNTKKYTVNGNFNGQTLAETLRGLTFIHQLKFIKLDSLNYKLMKK